ncbi:Predicted metal-dependent phosphohydrolase, HD superfamily [Hymenobacter daecheongensis DSM 21074]|uniref:Predicted metal-dependent phosphohydrolase, HD superfamily n=1 Tax=Hymenobacter daecheongensis DSM 21074 TaxID=1121955 RepID=A0A1M6L831_9BACT|nr:Pycsar system effector family protein [Hymenobacter daecheongensis]SHJ67335.1 Predicted metal-dependent phosphohydrolase, HD superfamily [Hymenobacter daecheongensis DSM 21074]
MEPTETIKPAKAEIVKKAKAYITALFEEKLPQQLVYHSLKHTLSTVKEAKALGEASHLSEADLEALVLAAWFHDAGYIEVYDGHEYRSLEMAGQWLREQGYPADRISVVQDTIRATHRDEAPETELQLLLTDADISSMGREDFFSNAELLRAEWETMLGKTYSNTQWAESQLDFLLTAKFNTDAAKERYGKQFKDNLKEQRKRLKKTEKKTKEKEEEATGNFADPKRGVETMFRTMYNNHIKLSDMADNKANMMISLNAVLISVIVTYAGAKMGKTAALGTIFSKNPILGVPMGILLITALGSVVTAILCAQPDVTSFKWLKRSPQIATNRRVNLLFFGNFSKLSLDDFQSGMNEIMREKDTLYTNMVTDIYYLGHVLTRKYRLLRISYTIFMVGLILVALSFGIAMLYKS